jgi:hypothetical protein
MFAEFSACPLKGLDL